MSSVPTETVALPQRSAAIIRIEDNQGHVDFWGKFTTILDFLFNWFLTFLETTFSISIGLAGIIGGSYAFMNLLARPGGGWISDRWGSRRTLFILISGGMLSHWLLGEVNSDWQISNVAALSLIGSIFFKAGNGACFAAVPLINKKLTGKIAGLVGAYGSVGAVCFLTLYSFVSPQVFFKVISAYAFLVFLTLFFLKPFQATP